MSLTEDYTAIIDAEKKFEEGFLKETRIRLWDGNWSLVAEVQGEYEHSFKFVNNDAGDATVLLPLDHYVTQVLSDSSSWPTQSMYFTFDKDGARWSGRVATTRIEVNSAGERFMEVTCVHDYQKLKELLVWSNPFLPAGIQFPKAWFLFGPSRWAVATTLFVNLLRKNASLWQLPDDPMNFAQWGDLDMANWSAVVKPVNFLTDSSLTAVVSSRFRYFHDCVKDILADAQLTIECRRFLPGDEQPLEGKTLRYGCLVFEVVDKSGYSQVTAVGGSLVTGFKRAIQRVQSDGLTEYLEYDTVPVDPEKYRELARVGTRPEFPYVVLNDGPYTGVESTAFEFTPAGASQFVTGGSSMPGVNEAIKASIIGLGGFIGSIFGQSQAGSVADALLEPLYSDVILAFMTDKDTDRIKKQGWDFPFEYWVDGADKAYTLSALSAMRKAKYDTRERFSCEVEMNNGAPYWVGPYGHGDFFIGDRVAVHALGMAKDQVFVEMVQELEYSSTDSESGWTITVGQPEFTSGFAYLTEKLSGLTSGLKELGVW